MNIQQSGLLFALQFTAKNREMLLENFYLKNKRAVEMGKGDGPNAWVIPAGQRRRGEAANFVNLLRLQGIEVHTANAAFTAGGVSVAKGDYLVRMDQPYSRCAVNFLDTQFFSPANPSPYDDTGWAIPLAAQRQGVEDRGQGGSRPADDAARGRREGPGRRSPEPAA